MKILVFSLRRLVDVIVISALGAVLFSLHNINIVIISGYRRWWRGRGDKDDGEVTSS